MSRVTAFLKQLMIAMFVAFMFHRLTITSFLDGKNRLFFFWARSDAVAVAVMLLGSALVLCAAYHVIAKAGRCGRWVAEMAFIVVAGFYIKVAVGEICAEICAVPRAANLLAKVCLAVVLMFAVFRRTQVRRVVASICLLLSPIVPVVVGTLCLAPSVRQDIASGKSPLGERGGAVGGPRVYWIILDGWSYERCFAENLISTQLVNIAEIASQSIVCHGAHSTTNTSMSSISSMLCGAAGELDVDLAGVCLVVGGSRMAVDEYDHVFKRMAARGYRTKVVGGYLPWTELFRSGVDESRTWLFYKYKTYGPNALQVARWMMNQSISRSLSIVVGQLSEPRGEAIAQNELVKRIHAETLAAIKEGRFTFCVVHYPVPHPPFIFDSGGLRSPAATSGTLVEKYLDNVKYSDILVGEVMGALSSSGNRENTIVILTADHGLRAQVDKAGTYGDADERHVPLIIHLPGQTNRVDIVEPISLADLPTYLGQYLDSDRSVGRFVEICTKK